MFEHSSLQELYTGSLIAGKGKHLNSIRSIMERTKFKHEDWARVRFGAGTPWRRCWCVVEPPDEKEWQRAAKTMKKRSAYERPQYPKGDIKFYDTKKTKKVTPIATITDAYSAYAIYPQSKPLIDQSTLVKVEGKITIHSNPESKTEGFVFVMPELHPAVSGFEMMLRWLFPVYDSFHLYGRPNRLIAETLDTKGLMFAMPKERRYGYLDIIDVAALIHTDGSNKWSEREWRKQMKEVTARRISAARENGQVGDLDAQRSKRNSMGSRTGSRNGIRYEDLSPTPSRGGHQYNMSTDAVFATQRKVTAPAVMGGLTAPPSTYHNRSASESIMASPSKGRRQNNGYVPSRLSMDHVDSPQHMDMDISPVPSAHHNYGDSLRPGQTSQAELLDSRNSSDSDLQIERTRSHAEDLNRDMRQSTPPGPVAPPPEFQHQPMDRPQKRPEVRPDVIRQKSRLSNATLDQMVQSSKMNKDNAAGIAAATAWRTGQENQPPRGVGHETPKPTGMSANQPSKAMVADGSYSQSPADIRPPEVRQPSEHSITLPPPLAQSRSTSESSVRRKPVPPPVPAAAPPPVPTRTQPSESASKYSDSNFNYDSDESPDYASTVRKSEDEKSIPKQRSGVLKTVGDVGASSTAPAGPPRSDVPDIDFGPTRALTPGPSRPSTAMGVVGSRSPLDSPAESTPERRSRTPENVTPEIKPARPGHSRGSSYAWQPATAYGRISPGPSLSPEEFVQQRFNAANYPSGYVPYRSSSASKVEQATAAAPKKLQKKRDSKSVSRNSLLGIDYSANLSAREQEHVARMTGGPLLNLGERNRTPDPSVGLIGAIEAREQEKRHIREGVSGHMVQAAIAQRHQHAQAQVQAQQAAERAYAQQYGYAPQYQQAQQQQQYTSWGQPIQQSPPQQQYYQQQQQQWQNQHGAPRQQQFQQQQYQQQQQGQQSPYNQQKFGGFY